MNRQEIEQATKDFLAKGGKIRQILPHDNLESFKGENMTAGFLVPRDEVLMPELKTDKLLGDFIYCGVGV